MTTNEERGREEQLRERVAGIAKKYRDSVDLNKHPRALSKSGRAAAWRGYVAEFGEIAPYRDLFMELTAQKKGE